MAARRKPMSEINVVPYIDVMLVLLVIFMATAPLFTQGVVVDLIAVVLLGHHLRRARCRPW